MRQINGMSRNPHRWICREAYYPKWLSGILKVYRRNVQILCRILCFIHKQFHHKARPYTIWIVNLNRCSITDEELEISSYALLLESSLKFKRAYLKHVWTSSCSETNVSVRIPGFWDKHFMNSWSPKSYQ